MKLFLISSSFLQLTNSKSTVPNPLAPKFKDYEYVDFFELLRMLDAEKKERENGTYKVIGRRQEMPKFEMPKFEMPKFEMPMMAEMPPITLKKTKKTKKQATNGIKIDVEKTTMENVERKKKNKEPKTSVVYDDYEYYDYDKAVLNQEDDYADSYYFYAEDMAATTARPTTKKQITVKPYRPIKAVSAPKPIAAPKPPGYATGLISAPKPPQQAYQNGAAYDEYYDYYYDDLGNKKKKKKRKQQKNYSNNYYPVVEETPSFECWECLSARSYDECISIGSFKTCDGGSIGCNIEVRSRRRSSYKPREIETIHMGCKQLNSCTVEHKYNSKNNYNWHPQCFPADSSWPAMLQWNHSTCRQCCSESRCNYQWAMQSFELDTSQEWESEAYHAPVPILG